MNLLKFLFGKNFRNQNLPFQAGTLYLDTENKELWFDDPGNEVSIHNKVIDTDTLVYDIEETITFPN